MDSKELRLLGEAYAGIQEGYGKKEEKEEKEEGCVPKSEKGEHNCAKKVCHEQFGEGVTVFGEHAEPDENGFVSHYDVLFGHGVEKNVSVSEMKVLVSEGHGKKKHRYEEVTPEGEQLDEMDVVGKLRDAVGKIGIKGTSPALDKERRAQTETERKGRYAHIKATGDGSYATGKGTGY